MQKNVNFVINQKKVEMLAEHYWYSLCFRGWPPAEHLGGRILDLSLLSTRRHNLHSALGGQYRCRLQCKYDLLTDLGTSIDLTK